MCVKQGPSRKRWLVSVFLPHHYCDYNYCLSFLCVSFIYIFLFFLFYLFFPFLRVVPLFTEVLAAHNASNETSISSAGKCLSLALFAQYS